MAMEHVGSNWLLVVGVRHIVRIWILGVVRTQLQTSECFSPSERIINGGSGQMLVGEEIG